MPVHVSFSRLPHTGHEFIPSVASRVTVQLKL